MASRRPPIIWSSDARADLSSIWLHYAKVAGSGRQDCPRPGRRLSVARRHPYGGRARDEVRANLRSVTASPHVIFYRVSNEIAEIVRVLDGRQDIDEIFADKK